MLARQRLNTIEAYNASEVDYDLATLEDIVDRGLEKKAPLVEKLKESVLLFERPKTNEELLESSSWLRELRDSFLEYAFDFSHKQVTHRESGVCTSLKKWLSQAGFVEQQIKSLLREAEATKDLIISVHPWFLIGCSIGKTVENNMNSCHHPCSDTSDYKSGPISLALDSQTIMFGVWEDGGLTGRQLVYIDLLAPGIVTGRLYGDLSEADSKFLRSKLYPLISDNYGIGAWKKSKESETRYIHRNGYSGYLDTNYFMTYRPQKDNPVTIFLAKAVCPNCGDYHRDGTLLCSGCGNVHQGEEQCACCGGWESEDDIYYVDSFGSVCDSCFHDRWFHCYRCGEVCDKDEVCITTDGEEWCEYCAEKKGYVKCINCGKYTLDYSLTINGEPVCEECVERYDRFSHSCYECNAVGGLNEFVITVDGKHYCENCEYLLNTCDRCGGRTDDDLEETVDGIMVCRCCVNNEYVYNCPSCTRVSEQPGACSHKCATANLFDMGV